MVQQKETDSTVDEQHKRPEDKSIIKKLFNKLSPNASKEIITAERAWLETTYGKGSYKPIEERIVAKQNYIINLIENKFRMVGEQLMYQNYQCVIDVEEDLRSHADEIFQPFRDNGFMVVNISECVSELGDEMIYFISWKHVFDRKN